MKRRYCDVTGCGREITGQEFARVPQQVKLPGVGIAVVSFTFKGPMPDVCNHCLISEVASQLLPEESDKVARINSARTS